MGSGADPIIPHPWRPALAQRQRQIDNTGIAPRDLEAAFLEDAEHRHVLGQDLRGEMVEPGLAGNDREVAHQGGADAPALMAVDHDKSQFGLPGPLHDVTAAADDYG